MNGAKRFNIIGYSFFQAACYAILTSIAFMMLIYSQQIYGLLIVILNHADLDKDILIMLTKQVFTPNHTAIMFFIVGSLLVFFFISRIFKSLSRID